MNGICHIKGCTNPVYEGGPLCKPCLEENHECDERCLRYDNGLPYCDLVEPQLIVVRRVASGGNSNVQVPE